MCEVSLNIKRSLASVRVYLCVLQCEVLEGGHTMVQTLHGQQHLVLLLVYVVQS